MKKIGFIGLGTMGLPMTTNMINAGYELTIYNRTKGKVDHFMNKGVHVADSPAEVVKQCEVVFTMLSTDEAVDEVLLGKAGIIEGAPEGLVVIDSSTISPNSSKKFSSELAKVGVEMLDAPVSGSEPQAIEGTLIFMVGGKKEVYERCLPLFNVLGKNSYYMGESGAGSYTKLANNMMGAINLLSLSESLVVATKAGINPELFVEVVSGGGARSGMLEYKAHKIMDRDFSPNFKTNLMYKDLGLATNLASELKVPVPVLSLVKEMLQMTINKGYGNEDMCAVIKCYEDLAGTQVKKW